MFVLFNVYRGPFWPPCWRLGIFQVSLKYWLVYSYLWRSLSLSLWRSFIFYYLCISYKPFSRSFSIFSWFRSFPYLICFSFFITCFIVSNLFNRVLILARINFHYCFYYYYEIQICDIETVELLSSLGAQLVPVFLKLCCHFDS